MKKAFIIMIFSVILIQPECHSKIFSGVNMIKKMYYIIKSGEYIDSQKLEKELLSSFRKNLPDIELLSYDQFTEKSDNIWENVILSVEISTLESGGKGEKGGGFANYLDMRIFTDDHDDIGACKKTYWDSGVLISTSRKYLISEQVMQAIEETVKGFAEEWNQTKALFNPEQEDNGGAEEDGY